MKNKTTAYILLLFALAYAFVLGSYGNNIAIWSMNQPPLMQLVIYYLTQPLFIIIIAGSLFIGNIKKNVGRWLTGGVLLDIAGDIISTPQCVPPTGFINSANIGLCSDTIYIHFLNSLTTFSTAWFIYYVIAPLALIIIAFETMGITKFRNYFRR